jgi:REP element-mobilizing transposase RayT
MQKAPVRKSARLADFDYSFPGGYFVTICVNNMEHRFGEVRGDHLILNQSGELIASLWESTAGRFPGTELDAFVVMPNHLHGIVILGTSPTETAASNLSRIIQAFKSTSTVEYGRRVRAGEFPPFDHTLWQRSFYDRMLRDERDVDGARRYIEANPSRWIERTKVECKT